MEIDLGAEYTEFRAEMRAWIEANAPDGLAELVDWGGPMFAGGRRGARLGLSLIHISEPTRPY